MIEFIDIYEIISFFFIRFDKMLKIYMFLNIKLFNNRLHNGVTVESILDKIEWYNRFQVFRNNL